MRHPKEWNKTFVHVKASCIHGCGRSVTALKMRDSTPPMGFVCSECRNDGVGSLWVNVGTSGKAEAFIRTARCCKTGRCTLKFKSDV